MTLTEKHIIAINIYIMTTFRHLIKHITTKWYGITAIHVSIFSLFFFYVKNVINIFLYLFWLTVLDQAWFLALRIRSFRHLCSKQSGQPSLALTKERKMPIQNLDVCNTIHNHRLWLTAPRIVKNLLENG